MLFSNNRHPRALQISPPPITEDGASSPSVGPFLSADRQLVHLLPYSHTSKPPICAGAVRIHKAAAMTGLYSTPSLSQIPLHAHLTLLITCFLHTRAGLQPRIESSVLRCTALSRYLGCLAFGRYEMTVCRPNVLHKSCVQCDSAVAITDYFCFLRTRLLSLSSFS